MIRSHLAQGLWLQLGRPGPAKRCAMARSASGSDVVKIVDSDDEVSSPLLVGPTSININMNY